MMMLERPGRDDSEARAEENGKEKQCPLTIDNEQLLTETAVGGTNSLATLLGISTSRT